MAGNKLQDGHGIDDRRLEDNPRSRYKSEMRKTTKLGLASTYVNGDFALPSNPFMRSESRLPVGRITGSEIAPNDTSVEVEGQRMAASQAGSFFGARHMPFLNVEDTVAAAIIAVPLKSRAT
jgi:hypothetical protein